jgi:hypothetical protein
MYLLLVYLIWGDIDDKFSTIICFFFNFEMSEKCSIKSIYEGIV